MCAPAPYSPDFVAPERICRHDRGAEQRRGMPGNARVRVSGVENIVSITIVVRTPRIGIVYRERAKNVRWDI